MSSQQFVSEILHAIGEDRNREGLRDTPDRVVKSWEHLYSGYGTDARKVLGTTFEAESYDQIVLLRDIELYSTCEHHMLPFYGVAHVAYIPSKRVVGLSKLARLVEVYARRLQIQERLTQQIAETLNEVMDPVGVAVVINAKHFCMVARGVQKQHSSMTTSAMFGAFKEDAKAREEFLRLINGVKSV